MVTRRVAGLRGPILAALALAVVWPWAQASTAENVLTGILEYDHGDDFVAQRGVNYPVLDTGTDRLTLLNAYPGSIPQGSRVRVRGTQIGSSMLVSSESAAISRVSGGEALAATTTATASLNKRVAILLMNFVQPPPTPTPAPTPSPNPTVSPTPTNTPLSTETPISTDTPLPTNTPLPTDTPRPTDSALPTDTPRPTDSPLPTASPAPTEPPTPSPTPTPTPTPPPQPWTKDYVAGVYFTNTRSVASYYAELSDGRISISGDVFGYFTLAIDTTTCSYGTWGTAARQAATAAGIDLTAYTNVVYAFPKQSACWWMGFSNMPGRNSWINGSLSLYVASHELGHNFGANHASSLSCATNGIRVAYSSSCTMDEYGDPFDIMGYTGQRHMQAWHLWQIGLLDASTVQTVTAGGDYWLATSELASGSPRIVRIPRPNGDYYYLEFRQPFGRYDNFASTAPVVNGITVRVAPDVSRILEAKLIDTTPETATYADAAMAIGRGFADNIDQIYMTTLAIGPSGATVRIGIGPDATPPGAPTGFTASALPDGAVRLSWTAATDDLFVAGYKVSRGGTLVASTSSTSVMDAGLTQATNYDYTVAALDGAGNVSQPAAVSVYLPDTTAPSAPTNAGATATGPHDVQLSWKPASDNVGVSGYSVSRDGVALGDPTDTTFVDATAPDGVLSTYAISAVDAAGNTSQPAIASVELPDITAPSLAGDLTGQITATGDVHLTWTSATDNVGVTGYTVSRDGTTLATAGEPVYDDLAPAEARSYEYLVVADDAAGNSSGPLQTTLYVPDVTPPSAPQTVSATLSGDRSVDVTWTAASDNVGIDHYVVLLDGTEIAATSHSSLPAVSVTDGQSHHFEVAAVDAAGNVGPSGSADIAVPDVTPPSAPGSFSAIATSSTTVTLTWYAATDNVGVSGYQLTRNGTLVGVLDPTSTSFVDAGLASDETYSYSLVAVDATGNTSVAASAQTTLVSVDVTPPTAPANLSGVALGSRRVDLTWTPSTDDRPGTIRYRIFRGTTRIATVTSLEYVDRPASVGTYKYRVRAVDAAGNKSAFSNAVWVKAVN